MNKIQWKTEKRKVADLKAAGYNPRKLSDKQKEDLVASIKEFGEVEPVVVNTNGTIVGGHQRIGIYVDLSIAEIVVRVPDRKLSKSEEKRLNLRLNKNTGEWDWSQLSSWDEAMLLEVGFSEDELKINLGLNDAEEMEIEEERMAILMVYPPESPKLKERAAIHCDNMNQYFVLKGAVDAGEITAAMLEGFIKKKK